MTLYIGMNRETGKAITETDHLRQSVRDILLTPQGSRYFQKGSLPLMRLSIAAARTG